MQRHYTLNQAKKEIKEMELDVYKLKIEVVLDVNYDGETVYDLYMNAYSIYSDRYYDGINIETYEISEIKKMEKRILKLSENYEIVRND